jgi:hypothetical protein
MNSSPRENSEFDIERPALQRNGGNRDFIYFDSLATHSLTNNMFLSSVTFSWITSTVGAMPIKICWSVPAVTQLWRYH